MSKDSSVKFRVSLEDKKKAQDLIEKLGCKNLSSFFRDYLESLLELDNKNSSELEFLEEFYKSKLNDPSIDSYNKFSLKAKLNLIKEFKATLEQLE